MNESVFCSRSVKSDHFHKFTGAMSNFLTQKKKKEKKEIPHLIFDAMIKTHLLFPSSGPSLFYSVFAAPCRSLNFYY